MDEGAGTRYSQLAEAVASVKQGQDQYQQNLHALQQLVQGLALKLDVVASKVEAMVQNKAAKNTGKPEGFTQQITNPLYEETAGIQTRTVLQTRFGLSPYEDSMKANNSTPTATKLNPFESVSSYPFPPKLMQFIPGFTKLQEVKNTLKTQDEILSVLLANLQQTQEGMKEDADRRRTDRNFEEEDWVYLRLQPYKQQTVAQRQNMKLSPRFYGSVQVLEKAGNRKKRGRGSMQRGGKSKCASTSHHLLMDNAKKRLNDLQERFFNIQAAREEGRNNDVALLEEQVCQSLREWKAELDVPSPANSLLDISLGSFSEDIGRLLQLCEEEDDATSPLTMQTVLKLETQPEPNFQNLNLGNLTTFQDEYLVNSHSQEVGFQGFHQHNSSSGLQSVAVSGPDITTLLDCHQFTLDEEFDPGLFVGTNDTKECGINAESNNLQYISPPPSAFMGPKCALWDCTRPAQGAEWCEDYCSSFHATLALNEGPPGMSPVLRPRGINLKDNLLFDALTAKMQGKNVGIPQCEGAAVMKSPWNAAELFDLSLLEGETIREWLFFDKPRRAFDSGNRKQRSLPDYSGRGWHESRKQVMKELGGKKKSYYMDPQPPGCHEWHLYEYEINNCDACALYRLELKLAGGKKTPKGKVSKDSLADLQKKMGRLTAVVTADNSPSDKGKTNADTEVGSVDFCSAQDQKTSGTGHGP